MGYPRLTLGMSCPILAPCSSYWKMVFEPRFASQEYPQLSGSHCFQVIAARGHHQHIFLLGSADIVFLICVYRNEQRFVVFYRKILRVLTKALNHLPALVFYTVVLLCKPIAPPLQLSYSPSPYPSPWQPLTRSVSTVYLLSECHRLTTFAKHLLSINIVTWESIRLC